MGEQVKGVDNDSHRHRRTEQECLVADDVEVGTLNGKVVCYGLDVVVAPDEDGYSAQWHSVANETVDIFLDGGKHILVVAVLGQHFDNHLTVACVLFLVFLFDVGIGSGELC